MRFNKPERLYLSKRPFTNSEFPKIEKHRLRPETRETTVLTMGT